MRHREPAHERGQLAVVHRPMPYGHLAAENIIVYTLAVWFEFRWINFNLEKIDKHGLDRNEVEFVIVHAARPYPRPIGNEKWETVGATRAGKWITVIYLVDEDDTIFVIHARPLTDAERRRRHHRQRRRRR